MHKIFSRRSASTRSHAGLVYTMQSWVS